MNKIISLSELVDIVTNLKLAGKKVVQCHGVFDVLHIGHLRHLEIAKSFGDVLVVTVTQDKFVNKGPDRPLFTEVIRTEMLNSLGVIDYIAVNEDETAVNAILKIKPDVYVKGREYFGNTNDAMNDEEAAVVSIGGKIVFTDDITFSSSNLVNLSRLPDNVKEYLKSFAYSYSDIVEWLEKAKNMRVLVISETIIDEYQYGRSIGKSGKSPVVAFNLGKNEKYDGGALVIRKHLQSFVKEVDIVRSNIIVKKRYIEDDQKLFETYDMDDNHPDICDEVNDKISDYDLVLVADFGHGLLTNKLRDIIKQKAKFLAVTTQRNAGNMGHNTIRKYWDRKDNIYICIDEDELRLAVHEKYSRHHDLKDIVRNELVPTSIVTGGPDGCVSSGVEVPALTTNVVDAVGAGDAFLSITSLLVCLGAPMDLVCFVGCVAGAIKVSYPGNREHITKKSLYAYVKTLLK